MDKEEKDRRTKGHSVKIIKWVVSITAILSLVFGLQQLIELIVTAREKNHQVEEYLELGKMQLNYGNYDDAWIYLQKADSLDKDNPNVDIALQDVAMKWLIDIHTTGDETFTSIVNTLIPTLQRGVLYTDGRRKADLLAHLGWADFLRFRDGMVQAKPGNYYRDALATDSLSSYAHTFLGHWLIVKEHDYNGARQHFNIALKVSNNREFVRHWQISALRWYRNEHAYNELLNTLNDMRKSNDHFLSENNLHYIFELYAYGDLLDSARIVKTISPEDELKTFHWIFDDIKLDYDSEYDSKDYCIAYLQEAAGHYESALESFKKLRSKMSENHMFSYQTDKAIARLSKHLNR